MRPCKTEVYSRVTGFFRPIKDWNPGKQTEAKERKHFDGYIKESEKKVKFSRNPLAYG